MSVRRRWFGGVIGVVILTAALLCGIVLAQRQIEVTAVVEYTDGFVDVKLVDTEDWVTLSEDMELAVGDEIQTGPEGQVILKLEDGSRLKIGPSSHVVIKELGMLEVTNVRTSTFELVRGKIRAVVTPFINKESSFTVETENATIGVRGTDFGLSFDPDLLKTYIISFEDCVSVVATTVPGLDPIEVCSNESLTVFSSEDPGTPLGIDVQKLEEFLKDMEMEVSKAPTGGTPPEILPPEVTSAFIDNNINTVIDLDNVDEFVTITRDNLTTQGKINVNGEAVDTEYPVASVEYSIDGGVVWTEAVIWEADGDIARWQCEFLPSREGEFELAIRASNSGGAVSNPSFFGPWTVKYWDATYEQIAQAFIDAFLAALESGDLTAIEDIISDEYDGSLGGYYSKDELLEALIHFFGTGEDIDITAVLEQISTGSIIATISWNGSVGGQHLRGSTTWWLDEEYDFTLVHAEGDWFIDLQEGIILTLLDGSGACGDTVEVLLVVPDVPLNIETVYLEVETDCDLYQIPLDRTYFFNERGVNTGFGGVFPVERTRCLLPPACTDPNLVQYDENGISATVSYDDYDYSISDAIDLPEDEVSLELDLDDSGFPCSNTVEIFVTDPSLRKGYASVDVELSTGSCDYINPFTLDAAYYDSRRTPGMGFGGVITVEMDSTCSATNTCSAPVISYNEINSDLDVTFVDPLSSDTLFESITLPDEDASLDLDLIEGGTPCSNRVEILLTKPGLVAAYPTVDVDLSTGWCDSIGSFTLDQAYYDSRMTPGMGYGGEITVEEGACSGTSCSGDVIGYESSDNELDVTFVDPATGEVLNEWIDLPTTLVPATVTMFQIDHGPGVCNYLEVMMRAPSVDAAISAVDVEIMTDSGGSSTYTLTRSFFDAISGYPPGEGFGERLSIENTNGDFSTDCCGGIVYHDGDTLHFLYDGSFDGNAYYVYATKNDLLTVGSASMTLTQIGSGNPSPCDVGVRIMYTIPAYKSCPGMNDYDVLVENLCGDIISVTLTRTYFEAHSGAYMMGFGGEIVVEPVPCGGPSTCSSDITYEHGGTIAVRDSLFGVIESIPLP